MSTCVPVTSYFKLQAYTQAFILQQLLPVASHPEPMMICLHNHVIQDCSDHDARAFERNYRLRSSCTHLRARVQIFTKDLLLLPASHIHP